MKFQHIRHATSIVEYKNYRILVDPMFSPAGHLPATPGTPNERANPLVELPIQVEEILEKVEAVIITHTHRDHLDDAAIRALPKQLPVLCQPPDFDKLVQLGFTKVTAVDDQAEWLGMQIARVGGHHGTGEIGEKMGPVSGFVLRASEEPVVYIAGDTIWCSEVKQALEIHTPDVVVLFAGAAQFLTGGPITMTAEDVRLTAEAAPYAKIIVEHLEAWNHCLLKRTELREFLAEHRLNDKVWIPADGEEKHLQ